MPAVSQQQARFFRAVRATQKGDLKHPSAKLRSASKSISTADAHDFAVTKDKGLPKKAADALLNLMVEKQAAFNKYAADLAADVCTVFAVKEAAFATVANAVRLTGNLRGAIKFAFPSHTPIGQERLFNLVIKAADHLRRKEADDVMGMGAAAGGMGGAGMGDGMAGGMGGGMAGGVADGMGGGVESGLGGGMGGQPGGGLMGGGMGSGMDMGAMAMGGAGTASPGMGGAGGAPQQQQQQPPAMAPAPPPAPPAPPAASPQPPQVTGQSFTGSPQQGAGFMAATPGY